MAVAIGEQRRKREAMDLLVQDLAKGDDDNVSVAIRTALEVRDFYLLFLCIVRSISFFKIPFSIF